MFMCAKIKPLVDETIRRVLLNKPWYFNLEQSMCCIWRVLCELQCEARGSDACEEEKQRGENDAGAQNKGGRGGRRDLFGKSCMVV